MDGPRVFLIVWLGHVVSLLGSNLTGFALGVWVYQQTASTTKFALISVVTVLPGILLSPLAGAAVDRWDRRRGLILSDAGSAACTLAIVLLLRAGSLHLWHIYLLQSLISSFSTFRLAALAATTTLLVPKAHLGRASGMMQAGTAGAQLLAPLLAGVLVGAIGIAGVVSIDFGTYVFSLLTLIAVRFPRLAWPPDEDVARRSLASQAAQGWSYLRARSGLLVMLGLFAATNLVLGMLQVLLTPLVLSFAPASVLGAVLSATGAGFLAGSLAISVWGGPKHRIRGILGGLLLQGAILLLGGLRPDAVLIATAGFLFMGALPFIDGCSQALWQTKVHPAIQGRVFAIRRMIAWSMLPFAYLIAGPLADRVFGPLLAPGGALAWSVGRLLGVGRGRGIGLLFAALGTFLLLAVATAFRMPRFRQLERELPDAVPDEPSPDAATAQTAAAEPVGPTMA